MIAATEDLSLQIKEQGYCLLRDVIPSDQVERVRADVLGVVDKYKYERTDAPPRIGAVSGLIRFTQSFAPYLLDSRLGSLCRSLLGEHYRVSYTSSIVNFPGNDRGGWHSDWPFNQHNGGHIEAPYADVLMHLTTLWMLSPFTHENGGTLIAPGTHREPDNPTGNNGVSPEIVLDKEKTLVGSAGTIAVLDSRLWHATAVNGSKNPRVGMAIRFAPWWLNLDTLMPESDERCRMADERGMRENLVPPVPREVFDRLQEGVKPLFRHWLQ